MTVVRITDDTIAEAKLNPGGHVMVIDNTHGPFDDRSYIPPQAIIGAWKVNVDGTLTGVFIANPNYQRPEGQNDRSQQLILLGNRKFG